MDTKAEKLGVFSRIILFGDSNTYNSLEANYWGQKLAVHFSSVADVLVRGYPGGTTRSCLKYIKQLPLPETLDELLYVFISFGINDSSDPCVSPYFHVPLDEYKSNIKKMIVFPAVYV